MTETTTEDPKQKTGSKKKKTVQKKKEQPKEIVRATVGIPIEPWRIAEDIPAHKARKCEKAPDCSACRLIRGLYDAQRSASGVANLIQRQYSKEDGAILDAFLAEHGRDPKGTKPPQPLEITWMKEPPEYYTLARAAYPELLSGITASVAHEVYRKWRRERWEVLVRRERSAPHYRDTFPIPLQTQNYRLTHEQGDTFILAMSLRSGGGSRKKEWQIPIVARDNRQRKDLHALTDGTYRGRAAKLVIDRKRKWTLRVSYSKLVETPATDTRVWAGLNRGILNFIAVATETEDHLDPGHDIEERLKQYDARRRKHQRGYTLASENRRGRGRKRALQSIEKLQERVRTWRQTKIHTLAKALVRWLSDRKVTDVVIEDFSGIRDGDVELLEGGKAVWDRIQRWPYYQMGQTIEQKCEEAGLRVHVVDPANISRTCIKCGTVAEEAQVARIFRCAKCGYKRHVDVVAAINVMRRGIEQERAEKNGKGKTNGKKNGAKKKNGASRKTPRKDPKS